MHLAHQLHRAPLCAQPFSSRQQVDCQVGIRRKAQQAGLRLARRRRRNRLRQHVQAARQRIAQHVRVVGAQVVPLHRVVAEPGAGLEVELADLDVVRKALLPEQPDVFELRVATEQSLHERLEVAALEIRTPAGHAQRKGGDDREPDPWLGDCAPHERVHQRVRLANADRQPEHYPPTDP